MDDDIHELTSSEVYTLATRLGTLLPDRRIVVGLRDQATQHRVADTLHAACRQAGVAVLPATVISETISSYLYGWGSRDAESEADVALALW